MCILIFFNFSYSLLDSIEDEMKLSINFDVQHQDYKMKNVTKYTKQFNTLTLIGTLSSYIRTTYDLNTTGGLHEITS